MKNFNMKRFSYVLRLDFAQGFKSIMWGSLRMLLLYLFVFWFAHKMSSSTYDYYNPDVFVQNVCRTAAGISGFCMFTLFMAIVSNMYKAEQKKQKRIVWLMLPASNLEKFVSHWLYVLTYSIISGVLMFFVVDAIHMLYLHSAGFTILSASSVLLEFAIPDKLRLSDINFIVSILCEYSFFLFGSIFFKRNNFIICASLLVITIMVLVLNGLHLFMYSGSTYTFLVINLCLIPLFTWLSYWLFCRWQVVTHKYANI